MRTNEETKPMNSNNQTNRQLLGERETNAKDRWRKKFRRHQRRHDPMLVLNMSIFNVGNGWDRVFNPMKAHENGAP